jgi:putative membrane protein
MTLLATLYPWLKACHVISMVAWMAGLFYLPRLFVYHCATAPGSTDSERFKVMEHRLLKQITTPAMLATFLFGALLMVIPGVVDWAAGWWHVKLAAVALLAAFHIALAHWQREFLHDRNVRTSRFFRFANEMPTLLLIVIVVMVMVRPF